VPKLLELDSAFKRLDRYSYIESLSLKEAKKEKARIDFVINEILERASVMIANKMALVLGGKKSKPTNNLGY